MRNKKDYTNYSTKLDSYLDKTVTVYLKFDTGTKKFTGVLTHSKLYKGYCIDTLIGRIFFKKDKCIFITT